MPVSTCSSSAAGGAGGGDAGSGGRGGAAAARGAAAAPRREDAHAARVDAPVVAVGAEGARSEHEAVGAERHRPAAPIARRLAVDVGAHALPRDAAPRVHAHVPRRSPVAVVQVRPDREHDAVVAQRHLVCNVPGALVVGRLAVEVGPALDPRGAVPRVHAHVAPIAVVVVVAVVEPRAHRHDRPVGAQRDRVAAPVVRCFAVEVLPASRPRLRDAVPRVDLHVAPLAVVIRGPEGDHRTVGAHRHPTRLVRLARPIQVEPLLDPRGAVPRVHARVAGAGSRAVVQQGGDRDGGAVGAHRHREAALVAGRLAVEVGAALRPRAGGAVPGVDARVPARCAAGQDAAAVVVRRADREHRAIGAQRHRVAALVARRLAVEVGPALDPPGAVPRVHAHVAPLAVVPVVPVVLVRPHRHDRAVGAQRQRVAALVRRRLPDDHRAERLVVRHVDVEGRRRGRRGRRRR